MGECTKVLIEDERLKLYDRNACSEIYWKAREYFVDDQQTKLSDAWGSVRVTPVNQALFDYLRSDGLLHRTEPDFQLSVAAIRKRDGIDFCVLISIAVRFKGLWEPILEHFKLAAQVMESYAGCCCRPSIPCTVHSSPMPAANEALLNSV